MTNHIYTVYKITNTINNKIYIGVHKTLDPNDSYLGSGTAIKASIKKYGKCKFIKEILFEYDNPQDAYLKEHSIVNKKFINRKDTYNLTGGGYGASVVTNETRIKLSKALKGKPLTLQRKKNISLSKIGKPRKFNITREYRLKCSISKLGTKHPKFTGYFITPIGKFSSATQAELQLNISRPTLTKWCKNSTYIITKDNIKLSKYLQSLNESPVGKTFKEIGFDFNSILP